MTPIGFDAELGLEGYEVMNSALAPNQLNPDHIEQFDARIMVLAGEITITRDGDTRMYRPGDYWLTPTHTVHSESAGPEGVAIIIGRRVKPRLSGIGLSNSQHRKSIRLERSQRGYVSHTPA